MAVKVARGVLSRIRSYPDNIVIQVQGASDPEAAAAALARAGKEIANLDAGWRSAPNLGPTDRNNPQYVSPVLPTGTGPFIQVDGGHVPYQTLRAIPDIVVRHLVEAGVAEATVASPKEGGPLTEMFASGRGPSPAVVLRLFPPPPLRWRQVAPTPDAFLAEAAAWVAHGLDSDDELRAAVGTLEFPLPAGAALAFLEQCRASHSSSITLVSGDLGARIRGVAGYFFGFEPNLALAGGGPAASDEELFATFQALVEVARRLAPTLGYALVSIDPDFGVFRNGRHMSEWSRQFEWVTPYLRLPLGAGPDVVAHICDEYVFDAFPYQVLGPGHLQRLGHLPEVRALEAGRVELAIGRPADWLIDAPPANPWRPSEGLLARRRNPAVYQRGWQLLVPCLLRRQEAFDIRRDRWRKNRPAGESRA